MAEGSLWAAELRVGGLVSRGKACFERGLIFPCSSVCTWTRQWQESVSQLPMFYPCLVYYNFYSEVIDPVLRGEARPSF